jgi:hypothetical protein
VLPVVNQKPQRQNNQHPRDQAFSYNLLQSFFPNSPQSHRERRECIFFVFR